MCPHIEWSFSAKISFLLNEIYREKICLNSVGISFFSQSRKRFARFFIKRKEICYIRGVFTSSEMSTHPSSEIFLSHYSLKKITEVLSTGLDQSSACFFFF
jgi:hypothetical protein